MRLSRLQYEPLCLDACVYARAYRPKYEISLAVASIIAAGIAAATAASTTAVSVSKSKKAAKAAGARINASAADENAELNRKKHETINANDRVALNNLREQQDENTQRVRGMVGAGALSEAAAANQKLANARQYGSAVAGIASNSSDRQDAAESEQRVLNRNYANQMANTDAQRSANITNAWYSLGSGVANMASGLITSGAFNGAQTRTSVSG